MKRLKMLGWGVVLFVMSAVSMADTAADKERREDVANHRRMAAAHEAAAQCLEAGKPEAQCERQLQTACKGLGIGKNCGMRHVH